MYLQEVENPLQEVVKHASLHCMEEVRFEEFAHDTRNMSKHIQLSVNMAGRVFGIGCLGIRIADRSL